MTLKLMFSRLQEVPEDSLIMKKEWTDTDEKTVQKAIKRLCLMKTLKDHNGIRHTLYTWEQIEEFFGLPYTSSSCYAMINNCNTEYFIDIENQFNIKFFALTENGKVILSAWDRDENEKYFII